MTVWNTTVAVVALVEAGNEAEAIAALTRSLQRRGFEPYGSIHDDAEPCDDPNAPAEVLP